MRCNGAGCAERGEDAGEALTGLALGECGNASCDVDGRSEDSEQTQNNGPAQLAQPSSDGAAAGSSGGSQTSVPGVFAADDVSASPPDIPR